MELINYGNDTLSVSPNPNNISPRRLTLGVPIAATLAHALDLALDSTQHRHRHALNSGFHSECTAAVRSSTAQSHPIANLNLDHPPLRTGLKSANDSLVDLCSWRK
jgi:hypothetical protein